MSLNNRTESDFRGHEANSVFQTLRLGDEMTLFWATGPDTGRGGV